MDPRLPAFISWGQAPVVAAATRAGHLDAIPKSNQSLHRAKHHVFSLNRRGEIEGRYREIKPTSICLLLCGCIEIAYTWQAKASRGSTFSAFCLIFTLLACTTIILCTYLVTLTDNMFPKGRHAMRVNNMAVSIQILTSVSKDYIYTSQIVVYHSSFISLTLPHTCQELPNEIYVAKQSYS